MAPPHESRPDPLRSRQRAGPPRWVLAAAAPLLLAGCLPWLGGDAEAPLDLSAEYAETPDVVEVRLDDRAHIALFEVVTNRGVALVHPSPTSGRSELAAGTHAIRIDGAFRTSQRAHYRQPTTVIGNHPAAEEAYLFALASTAPLDLAPILEEGRSLRSLLGVQDYASANPDRTVRALAELLVEDWDADRWVGYRHPVPRRFLSARR